MRTHRLLQTAVAALAVLGAASLKTSAQTPPDFPAFTVTAHDPGAVAEGYLFLNTTEVSTNVGSFAMILRNDGTPVWYQRMTNVAIDFKPLPNGLLHSAEFYHTLSWTGGGVVNHRILDENSTLRETISTGNGYLPESHDIEVLPNGNVLLLSYYQSQMDLSQVATGAYPNALVAGAVLQELNAQRDVVWQWRSWDYYAFQTYYAPVLGRMPNLKNPVLDSFHINSVTMDSDENLLVSNFPVDVQKINRQTGEVVWRLGGFGNQFTFVNVNPVEALGHFAAHSVTRLPNGTILLYCNSDQQATRSSKVYEYALDETNKVARLVWSYAPNPAVYGWHAGNAQRLPNGNTLIGWGGGGIVPGVGGITNRQVPACTEVTPSGRVVFELKFNDPMVASYRAFRFPWPPTNRLEYAVTELSTGNEYVFEGTGVSLEVLDSPGGYNACIVTREPYAPVAPLFLATPPRVLPIRVRLSEYALGSISARISFDVTSFDLDPPTDLTIYHRSQAGQGIFLPQPTEYNPTTRQLRTTLTLTTSGGDFGEFVFARPGLAHTALPPILNEVENYRGIQPFEVIAPLRAVAGVTGSVNQSLPVHLSWSPKGFANSCELQIADDSSFDNLLVSQPYATSAFFVWSNAAPATTYCYRVRTRNDAGESDWSTGSFQTAPPALTLTSPNGGEMWQRGSRYFIQWDDNLAEKVILDLYKGGAFLSSIRTNASTGAYSWEVGLGLTPGSDYAIRIRSAANPALFDLSDQPFSIVDAPTIDAASVLRLPDGRVQFNLTAPGAAQATVWSTTTFAPSTWQNRGSVPVAEGNALFIDDSAAAAPVRYYRVTVP